jgi:hypothetical protein
MILKHTNEYKCLGTIWKKGQFGGANLSVIFRFSSGTSISISVLFVFGILIEVNVEGMGFEPMTTCV